MPGLTRSEALRKTVHIGSGLFALLLRFLGPFWSLALALTAVFNNFVILPRIGGRGLWRPAEKESGKSVGILLYPLAVTVLILVFWRRLEVAAAAWGLLAFGDGMAGIVGMTVGSAKLPWNPHKSWAGIAGFFLFGGAAAAFLLLWTAPGRYPVVFACAVAFAAALVAAFLESLPQGLDDNFGVPLVGGLLILGLLQTQEGWLPLLSGQEFWLRAGIGVGINLVLALAAYSVGGVDRSGMIAGFFIGAGIYAFLDWRGYLLLLAFFFIGTSLTKLGYDRKAEADLAQEGGGRRGARHAFANSGVALACAVLAATSSQPLFYAVAFASAFATAVADTAGSEIGQLWGRRTFLITTFRPVPRGTEGAVSLEGTLAGIAASAILGALGAWAGLYPWIGVAVVVAAAFVGTTLESLVGATLEKRGLLDNEAVNFLNTLIGALVGGGLSLLL